jgi:DNA mismatch repair protein MSH3
MAKLNQTSQVKGQKSISSFFTPKSTQAPRPSQPSPPVSEEPNIYSAESDDEAQSPVIRPKRVLIEDSNGGNGGLERPAKRAKGDEAPETSSNKSISGPLPRTEKYLYTGSSQVTQEEQVPEDEDTAADRKRKEALHQKWVRKMGGAQVGRRWNTTEETPATEDGDGDELEEEEAPPTKAKRKGAKTGKLTPLEVQILDIKRKHMDTLLIIEVGYKFKFFGEDARIAAKELSIVCIPGKFRYDEREATYLCLVSKAYNSVDPSEAHLDRFASASIPVHRLPVHAKRLVAAGHKIGVVRQIETAALKKAGDNRNTPFVRKLTNVYTKGTYIDDVDGSDLPGSSSGGAPATGYLLCITEMKSKGFGTDEKVDVGILAVQPATGDIIYDTFEDGFMRNEIETRLLHLAPCEFLIVGDLTKATDKLVQHLSGSSTNVFGDRVRVERIGKDKTFAAEAHSHVTQFYADKLKATQCTNNTREQTLLDKVLKLPEEVTMCLSAMIKHMTEYGLEHVFDLTKYFQSFSARSHMLLNGNTLTSLEIYQNSTDYTARGSLFWTLDKTQTRFGQRLLRKWVGKPLLDQAELEERVDAVEELANGHQTHMVDKLRALLRNIKSDLERSLIRIYYGKCTRPELLVALQTLQRIATEYASVTKASEAGFSSSLINSAISSLPTILPTIISILDKINAQAARTDDKYAFFREEHETDSISDHKLGIAAVESELDAHLAAIKNTLHSVKAIHYTTVAGIEYLVEVSNTPSELRYVPASWSKISGTKKVSRFHTPEVVRMLRERDQHKESLSAACDVAFSALMVSISANYALLRDAVSSLATLDCLLSLATVAILPGYCKPSFITPVTPTHSEIQITSGRHPMIEQLLPETYIPNSTSLCTQPSSTNSPESVPTPKALLITGPNMGGKSSYVRQTALLCLLAQIGSFVPASSMSLTPLTSIYTRMGAYDSLFTSQSTFQCELSETSTILSSLPTSTSSNNTTLNPRSLVILDELGRGTSTHDGTAIAGAVLDYIVRETRGCLLLFITHYQSLSGVSRGFEQGGELQNVHMKFNAMKASGSVDDMDINDHADDNGDEEITFLYEVGKGVAHRSYGLNVARLANVPKSVLDTAAMKSRELEAEVKQKKFESIRNVMCNLLSGETLNEQLDQLIVDIEEL